MRFPDRPVPKTSLVSIHSFQSRPDWRRQERECIQMLYWYGQRIAIQPRSKTPSFATRYWKVTHQCRLPPTTSQIGVCHHTLRNYDDDLSGPPVKLLAQVDLHALAGTHAGQQNRQKTQVGGQERVTERVIDAALDVQCIRNCEVGVSRVGNSCDSSLRTLADDCGFQLYIILVSFRVSQARKRDSILAWETGMD